MQIQRFFFFLLNGFFSGALINYLDTKILALLLFNRRWCGWACWTAMVLDLLPYQDTKGRKEGRGKVRYLHFVLSLRPIVGLWYIDGYRVETQLTELYWLLGGNTIYYGLGINFDFSLKDIRAFCKYICPITVFSKASSGFSFF